MTTVRARDLGIPFTGTPGPLNAITDVAGVEIGYTTLIDGRGPLRKGKGPVRTGVTAVHPRGKNDGRPWFGGSFALNGAGEVTGLTWLEERGLGEGPICITNTHSVGVVRDATIAWMSERGWIRDWVTPIVGETYDGFLNDIDGQHVRPEHVFAALDSAQGGAIAEGSVGGGTGMTTYEYKAGSGTASRRLSAADGGYTVGVFVQSNYGKRQHMRIAGLPMGVAFADDLPRYLDLDIVPDELKARYSGWCTPGDGSIIVIVATDAPLMPHQLRRLAKRPSMGIARLGGVGASSSGDIFLALSTANPEYDEFAAAQGAPPTVAIHPNHSLTPLFEAAIDATEEAIVNAMVAADAMEGIHRLHVPRLPHDRVRERLAAHNLLVER